MNIFKILANGDGRINEANISAFLGYLLDPKADHGLGFEFLERFLVHVCDEDFIIKKYDYEVFYEQAFRETLSPKKEILDIVIFCFEDIKGNRKEGKARSIYAHLKERKIKYTFLIENKVRKKAKCQDQLKNQFLAHLSELKINTDCVFSIYITPDEDSYIDEFKNFTDNKNKTHLVWKTIKSDTFPIIKILFDIIREESLGEIEAINEYTKHTIKSFIKFIENNFISETEEKKERMFDGTYTKKYKDLNESTKIFDRLENLKSEIEAHENNIQGLKVVVKTNDHRFPKLLIPFNNILIDINAGSEARDTVTFLFRLDPERPKESLDKLKLIATNLELKIKMLNTKQAYCRTEDMKTQIPIKDTEQIWEKLMKTIEFVEKVS